VDTVSCKDQHVPKPHLAVVNCVDTVSCTDQLTQLGGEIRGRGVSLSL
jgi:hypothetical protein